MNSGKSTEIYLQLVDTYYMSVMKPVDMKNTQIHEEPLNHYDASIGKNLTIVPVQRCC